MNVQLNYWLFSLSALFAMWGAVSFIFAMGHLKRTREWHHAYLGWAIAAASLVAFLTVPESYVAAAGWVMLGGTLVALEDATVHAIQAIQKMNSRTGYYRPDWEIGLLHRLAHYLRVI